LDLPEANFFDASGYTATAATLYPNRPPLGYPNNKAERTIEIDPVKASLARRMFDL